MISLIGTGSSSATTVTIPAGHQAGDLLVIFAFNQASITVPTVPAGWTAPGGSGLGGNVTACALGYKFAASAAETSGTWTTSTEMMVYALRNVDSTNPLQATNAGGAASTTVNYPSLTLANSGGTSWVIGFAGHTSTDTTLETPPSGMSNRITLVDANAEVAAHDTNGSYIETWASTNVSVGGTSAGWKSIIVEIEGAKPTNNNYLRNKSSGGNTGIISIGEAMG